MVHQRMSRPTRMAQQRNIRSCQTRFVCRCAKKIAHRSIVTSRAGPIPHGRMQASATWDKATVLYVRLRRPRRVTRPICHSVSKCRAQCFPRLGRTHLVTGRDEYATAVDALPVLRAWVTRREPLIIITTIHVVAGTQDRSCDHMRRQPNCMCSRMRVQLSLVMVKSRAATLASEALVTCIMQ